jgi:hypothetical protein
LQLRVGVAERAPITLRAAAVGGAPHRRLNDRARPGRQRRRNWVRPVPREPSHLRLDLHGLAGHAREWDRMARAFDDLHVLAVDLRGHGSSDWADSYAVDAYVHDVEGVVERVVSGPVMVVGHSLGGISVNSRIYLDTGWVGVALSNYDDIPLLEISSGRRRPSPARQSTQPLGEPLGLGCGQQRLAAGHPRDGVAVFAMGGRLSWPLVAGWPSRCRSLVLGIPLGVPQSYRSSEAPDQLRGLRRSYAVPQRHGPPSGGWGLAGESLSSRRRCNQASTALSAR